MSESTVDAAMSDPAILRTHEQIATLKATEELLASLRTTSPAAFHQNLVAAIAGTDDLLAPATSARPGRRWRRRTN